MTRSYLQSGTKCRLLTLLVVCVLSAANSVVGQNHKPQLSGTDLDQFYPQIVPSRKGGETTQIRHHALYHKCSESFVQIERKGRHGVNAWGKKKMERHVQLIFETTLSGTLLIYGAGNDLQLCFNRRGKLIARRKAGNLKKAKRKGRHCEFQEVISADGHFWQFRSADQPHFYVGFKKNGKPLKGLRLDSSKDDCYKFLKLPVAATPVKRPCKKGNGPSGVECNDLTGYTRIHGRRGGSPRRPSGRGRPKG